MLWAGYLLLYKEAAKINTLKVLKDFKYLVPLHKYLLPTRQLTDINSTRLLLNKLPHNLYHLLKHQDYILDVIKPLSQLQNSIASVFCITSYLLIENIYLQDEVSGIKQLNG